MLEAALLDQVKEENRERSRRDWFELGAKMALSEALGDPYEYARALTSVMATFDAAAAKRRERSTR